MLEYEVTYETQNGNHTTINVITSSLIKAARFAESEPKGECVIVISPCDNNIAADNTKLRETVGILLNTGIGPDHGGSAGDCPPRC